MLPPTLPPQTHSRDPPSFKSQHSSSWPSCGNEDCHKCWSCCQFSGDAFHRTAGVQVWWRVVGVTWQWKQVMYTIGTPCKPQSWSCRFLLHPQHLFFITSPLKESSISPRGHPLHSDPLLLPSSKSSHCITLVYSSPCDSRVVGPPTRPSECLLVLPPLAQRWPCLDHQDALLPLQQPTSLHQSSLNELKWPIQRARKVMCMWRFNMAGRFWTVGWLF